MLTEKNFSAALQAMNFTECGNFFEKTFADNVTMSVDLKAKKLFYPAQIVGRDRNNFFDESHRENLVVFECVNRLLDKGYRPEDIELERAWHLGHSSKSGRADICVNHDGQTLFIVECKTFGEEFRHELDNMNRDGGQLFSYRQQEQSCQWLVLYASTFERGALKIAVKSVSCNPNAYRDAHTVEEFFKIWCERYEKIFFDDVIFNAETVAYKIGVKPLRKRDLKDFIDLKSVVNNFEEILRHNPVSNKANAFDVLIALFICKLADESQTADDGEVSFQFKYGTDSHETFQDRLQRLYSEGMEKFLKEKIEYVPLSRVDDLLRQLGKVPREELIAVLKYDYRRMKFFSPNVFAFINVYNEKLFYLNGRVLFEVVQMLREYKIIGSKDLQTLGDLFEQLLNKGFKQDEGQFFTPVPIARFIWDSLLLDEIIFRGGQAEPPKIIDYSCGAGHFLTEGYQAVNDCFTRNNLPPPVMWERDKLFGIEKDPRLATVSKISLFMHGANEGKIKFGDGLEDYPDENIAPETFDVLVANPPYSVKGFKKYLQLANENFSVLDKISNDGSEIETLFVERISQLVKPKGVAAVILPSSILNKDGKSFIAARESLLKNFYVRALVRLGSKTFGATGTNTVIVFLQRIFDPPERARLVKDSAEIILHDAIRLGDEEEAIFADYTKKLGVTPDDYKKFIAEADDKTLDVEREKIIYFALTYRQTTLIVTAPDDNKQQEIFLGYGWSNAKGREGIVDKKRGGLLFDNKNRIADNTLAAVIRAAFNGEQRQNPALEKYFRYAPLADLLDFDAADFTKKISVGSDYAQSEYSGDFKLVKLGDVAPFVTERTTVDAINLADFVTTDNMLKDKRGIKLYDGEPQISGVTKFLAGDVLVSNIRPYLKKIWLADRTGGCSPDVLVFRSHDEKILLPEYLFEVLRQDDFFAFAMATAKGMKMPRGDKDKIQTYKLPLPPVDVQKKIVDEFRALDAQIDSADETIQSLDADIQKKFAALFGDNRHGYKYPAYPFEKFVHVRGGDTFKAIYQGSTNSADIPFYKVSDMNSVGNEKVMGAANNYVSESVIVNEIKATIFDEGTIIFPKVGMAIGTNKKRILGRRASVDNNIMAIWRKDDSLDDEYLFAFLQFCFDLSSIANVANPPSISAANFNKAKIPVPPLELQEEFAAYVATCEAMKQSARERRDALVSERAALVTKYFR